MNIQSLLEHHGIIRNPFAEEDAQTDPVFKEHCIHSAYHPIWDKVYGDPTEPSTSIIFGPKGSGKTAMRLQIDRHLKRHSEEHPRARVFVIRYDDFNPFLDHFCERIMGFQTHIKLPVFSFAPAVDAWTHGADMSSVESLAGQDGGDVVRTMRMTVQMMRQLRSAVGRDYPLADRLQEAEVCVNRDVVDAKRQFQLG